MEKNIQRMMAEVVCRLVVEAFTGKSADGIPDDVVRDDGSFVFSTPEHTFKITVEKTAGEG